MATQPQSAPGTPGSLTEAPAPVVFVSDLGFERFDPADLFDLAFLLRSSKHRLSSVCLTAVAEGGDRTVDRLSLALNAPLPGISSPASLLDRLEANDEAVNLVAVGGFAAVRDVLARDPVRFRERVVRLFLVGGQANRYTPEAPRLLPIDPRLRAQAPERYAAGGDPRLLPADAAALNELIGSGQAVIWLPRDISLWSYAAPQLLAGGGSLADFLRQELFYANLAGANDRYQAADQPVLLSTLPALLLATLPDPFAWMRLFRTMPARWQADKSIEIDSKRPNLHVVTAIDGQALGKLMTACLRDPVRKPGLN